MIGKALFATGLAALAAAQFPLAPEGVTTLKSKFHDNVTISFKEPHLCEETKGVKSYAGHVHLPAGFLQDVNGEPQKYPVNTFFWFFESRKDPLNAPLAIWLNGGPGASSLMGLLQENGPCSIAEDSKTTVHNPWSWNNEVNMLYIDEPNQVGFSYDVPTNFTVVFNTTLGDFEWHQTDFSKGLPELNATTRVGTFASQDRKSTTNSTAQAAHALWHFAQTWFFEFPHYKPHNDKVSLWAESYGGHYGPGFMRFFQQQNERIKNGTIEVDNAHYIHLDSLGIVNGILDDITQEEGYINFPYNNTYGIQVFNKSLHAELLANWTAPGGCKEQRSTCQDKLAGKGISLSAFDARITSEGLCDIEPWCESRAVELYTVPREDGRGWFDVTHPQADPFPPSHIFGYLMQESVLQALGVPVNFTASSNAVASNFQANRDFTRGGFLDAVGYLLDSGVKVHMMYGDRDYACNWIGGELASLAIPYSRAPDFAEAGYMPLLTGHGFDGMTRQFGNYSFTRVFQSGHMVPSYQPQAAYEIFMRAMFNKDIATGTLPVSDELKTEGPKDTWSIKNRVPEYPEPKCYVLWPPSCEPKTWDKVIKGEAVIKDYYVVDVTDEADDGWVVVDEPSGYGEEQDVIGDGEL